MREGTFHPLVLFGSYFVSWVFIKIFQTFLEAKIDINRVNLMPCQAHCFFKKMLLGGAKDEHFSWFHSSCQLELSTLVRYKSVDGALVKMSKCVLILKFKVWAVISLSPKFSICNSYQTRKYICTLIRNTISLSSKKGVDWKSFTSALLNFFLSLLLQVFQKGQTYYIF